ncbi:MAG: hypothetical protein GC150_02585 [Rhizobiales bacterium]|nr:hypothetical protein [Hyphomicrobiales bacterium]
MTIADRSAGHRQVSAHPWWGDRRDRGWFAIALLGLGAALAAAAVPNGRALLSSGGVSAPVVAVSPVAARGFGESDDWTGDVVVVDPVEEQRLAIVRAALTGSRATDEAHDESAAREPSGLLVHPMAGAGAVSDLGVGARSSDTGLARGHETQDGCDDSRLALSEAALLACPFAVPRVLGHGEVAPLRAPAAMELPRAL